MGWESLVLETLWDPHCPGPFWVELLKRFPGVGDLEEKCSGPTSLSCGNVFSLLAVLPQGRTADADSKKQLNEVLAGPGRDSVSV